MPSENGTKSGQKKTPSSRRSKTKTIADAISLEGNIGMQIHYLTDEQVYFCQRVGNKATRNKKKSKSGSRLNSDAIREKTSVDLSSVKKTATSSHKSPVKQTAPTERRTVQTPSSTETQSSTSISSTKKDPNKKQAPLLTAIKPENERSEKKRFFQARFLYNPLFIYRNPAPAAVLERFNHAEGRFLPQAVLIMKKALEKYGCYEKFEEITGGKVLTRPEILNLVKRYLKLEELEDEINLNFSEDLLSRASMTRVKGKATLNVRIVNLREEWVNGLLRHEIGTHYMRSCNNKYQVWYNWKKRKEMGLRPYNPTEEGLASLHSVFLRKEPSLWRSALLYYTTYKASYLPFKELFDDLGQFVKDPDVRWDYCMRAKRGQRDTAEQGGFSKDQVYLEGALELLKNRRSIDFQHLVYFGKIAYQDMEKCQELADLTEARIPRFMKNYESYMKDLDRVAECNGLTDEELSKV